MYLLQLTKRIYSPKNRQSKQLLFRNRPPNTCRADAENSPKENPAPEIGWPRNFLYRLSCFGPIHERSSQRSGHRLIKQVKFRRASAMMEKYRRDYQFFTISMFTIWNCKHASWRFQRAAPADEVEGEEKKKRISRQCDFLKANMWPADEKFLLWN